MIDLEKFKQSLAETIWWCSQKADISKPKKSLRSKQLRPGIFEKNRFENFEKVNGNRECLVKSKVKSIVLPKNLGNGQLIIYFPELNLYDGWAENCTEGFFDIDNVPPWDTWVGYFEDDFPENHTEFDIYDSKYLVSWVPENLIEHANEGIMVNPEECIIWLTHSEVELAKLLRKENLV